MRNYCEKAVRQPPESLFYMGKAKKRRDTINNCVSPFFMPTAFLIPSGSGGNFCLSTILPNWTTIAATTPHRARVDKIAETYSDSVV